MATVLDTFQALTENVRQAENVLEAAERARSDAPRRAEEVLAPLVDYWRAVDYNKRNRDPAEERRLERAFKKAIGDYRVRPKDPHAVGAGFILVDPKPDIEYEDARRQLADARRERNGFVKRHRETLAQDLRGYQDEAGAAAATAREQARAAENRRSELEALEVELTSV